MDDEKLITLVQNKNLIYNKRNPAYKLPDEKRKAWREIAACMGCPEEMCKKRWTSLRDRYAREKKLDDQPSGSGSNNRFRWELMSAMEFLSPFVVPRPMRCSTNILEEYITYCPVSSPLSIEIPSESSSSLYPSPIEPPPKSFSSGFNSISNCSTPSPSTQTIFANSISNCSTPSPSTQTIFSNPVMSSADEDMDTSQFVEPSNQLLPKRKRKNDSGDVELLFSEAVTAFKKICESEEEKKANEENEGLKGFGKMIVSTIAEMSSKKQVIAMQRVTALVMELRLEPDE